VARDFVGGEPFAVLLPDNVFLAEVPPLAQLKRLFSECSSCCVGTMAVPENRTIFFTSAPKISYQEMRPGIYRVESFRDDHQEPVSPGQLRSIGRYILTSLFFDYCSRARNIASGELRETDVLREYLRAGHQLYGLLIDGERFDTGSMEGYIHAFVSFIDRGL
jgi:UTP--glucose-1-phosphate uridylyltransferase